jgi:hypothetical protein
LGSMAVQIEVLLSRMFAEQTKACRPMQEE